MEPRQIVVKVADFRVGRGGDTLVTYGLGSCVAIALYDDRATVGGLAHILLPTPALARRGSSVHKFPQTAIPLLLEAMVAEGAQPRHLAARLIGGAAMFNNLVPTSTIQMGERNIVATRKTLNAHRIPVTGEAVGGNFGRTVRFDVASGVVEVSSVRLGVERI